MTVLEAINFWRDFLAKNGNVELHAAEGDGRATWIEPYTIRVRYTDEWPSTKGNKKWIVS